MTIGVGVNDGIATTLAVLDTVGVAGDNGVSVGGDTWRETGVGVCVGVEVGFGVEVRGNGVEASDAVCVGLKIFGGEVVRVTVTDAGTDAETIDVGSGVLIFCTINTPLVQKTQTTASARIVMIVRCRLVIVVFSQAVIVTPSGAKYLSKWITRYFAALSMTIVAFMQTKGVASRCHS